MRAPRTGQDVQAEIIKAARKGQHAVTKTLRARAERLPKPEVLATNVRSFAARLPDPERLANDVISRYHTRSEKVAGDVRNFAARLPKPGDLAENVIGIASRLPKPDRVAGNVRGLAARLPRSEDLAGGTYGLAGKVMARPVKFAEQVRRTALPAGTATSGATAADMDLPEDALADDGLAAGDELGPAVPDVPLQDGPVDESGPEDYPAEGGDGGTENTE